MLVALAQLRVTLRLGVLDAGEERARDRGVAHAALGREHLLDGGALQWRVALRERFDAPPYGRLVVEHG